MRLNVLRMRFKLRGTSIHIGFPFAVLLFAAFTYAAGGTMLLLVLSSLFHEAGHLACMFFCGVAVNEVRFGLFGINIIRSDKRLCAMRGDVLISLGGPAASVLLCLIGLAVYTLTQNTAFARIALINAVLAGFNLLPVYSLDGGTALYAHICMHSTVNSAEKCITVLSFITVIPVIITGMYIFLYTRGNFTVLFCGCYLLLMMILKKQYNRL